MTDQVRQDNADVCQFAPHEVVRTSVYVSVYCDHEAIIVQFNQLVLLIVSYTGPIDMINVVNVHTYIEWV